MGFNPDSRTPVSYYGGKQALIAHIKPMIPPHEVYTEVFFGGGSVFFAKSKAKNETINDRLDYVVNFYEQIKLNFKPLKELVDASIMSRTQHKRAQAILKAPKGKYSPTERAWAFWYTANWSFANKLTGGIKYSNDQNACVTEQIRNKKKRFTEWLVHRIEDAYIENNDALVILESRNVAKAFHYIDPPYYMADQGHYKGYTEADYRKLLEWLEGCRGKFLLSNYDSPVLDEFIARNGWHIQRITKRISAPKVKTRDKTEVLVSNYTRTSMLSNRLFI